MNASPRRRAADAGMMRDETGKNSLGRALLVVSLAITFGLIVLDSLAVVLVPVGAYGLLGTIFTGLLAWVAGPRIARYIGPRIGEVASGISGAARRARDKWPDQER